MASKVILITGANTGIGYEIVRALCSSSHAYDIIVGGRSPTKLSPIQIDIESDDSINNAFGEVQSKFGKLDILVNNAGAQFDQLVKQGKLSEREAWNQSWNVNTSSTQVMTSTFIPLLLQASDPRLLFITSGTSTLAGSENQALAPGFGVPAYRSAKTDMNMLMREWHKNLHEDGVKKMGAGNPEIAGSFFRRVIEGERDSDVGKVINKDGIQPW
ncbi:NAD(P)-binding protein [Periconia macrospinosa]|uniref:NAD(P)-binding protein n=1 Tax=Periconia macrospinosa TaxID=97972 RepID=A0A2V1DAD8_9PLEO|nr:NAD(P)-binding protein [Periconia macrospinosa]